VLHAVIMQTVPMAPCRSTWVCISLCMEAWKCRAEGCVKAITAFPDEGMRVNQALHWSCPVQQMIFTGVTESSQHVSRTSQVKVANCTMSGCFMISDVYQCRVSVIVS
jgi:hypothetical protein